MMNQSILVGYDPHCCMFERKRKGGVYFQLQYNLPGGKRRTISLGNNKKEAQRGKFLKERLLREGQFDEVDIKKMPDEIRLILTQPLISLPDALERYLVATAAERQSNTNRNIRYPLQKVIKLLDVKYINEVTGEHVQKLNSNLVNEGLADATRHSYLSLLESFFNWLIEVARLLESKNPVSLVKKPPRLSKVRGHLVKQDEVGRLFTVAVEDHPTKIPIKPMIGLILTTGCRSGEAIHAEWDDFDLQKGIWLIRHKPECPTRNGLGWSPKWGKERSIKLLPEAINFLKQLSERPEVYGQVGIGKNAYWKKANFVFTIQKKIMIEGSIQDKFVGVRDFRTAWNNLRCKAGLPDLQVKDLRTFFNWLLGTKSDLSNKELGCYIGNTERVNLDHYTPYSLESSNEKLKRFGLSQWIPGLTQ